MSIDQEQLIDLITRKVMEALEPGKAAARDVASVSRPTGGAAAPTDRRDGCAGSATDSDATDLFDLISVVDSRVFELSIKAGQPAPFVVLQVAEVD